MMLAQSIVNGLFLASAYSVIALGLAITVGVMKVINFAHGQMYVLGGLFSYFLFSQLGVNPYLSILSSCILLFLVGILVERLFFEPVIARSEREENVFLLAAGIALLMESLMLLVFSERQRTMGSLVTGVVDLGGVFLPHSRLVIMVCSVIVVASVLGVLKWTKWGRALRAVAFDQEAASMQGINPAVVKAIGFGIGAMLAGFAGAMLITVFAVNPGGGGAISIKAFLMIMIGGGGNLAGALIGATLLGMAEALGYTYLPGSVNMFLVYCAVIFMMFFKPSGILKQ